MKFDKIDEKSIGDAHDKLVQSLRDFPSKILQAKSSAVPMEEYTAWQAELNELAHVLSLEQIDPKDYDARMEKLDHARGVVNIHSISEFKLYLEMLGLLDEKVAALTAHENAHLNKAQELGADGNYTIRFIKDEIGNARTILPAMRLKFPPGMSAKERADIFRQVVAAPEVLSENDKIQLGKLNSLNDV